MARPRIGDALRAARLRAGLTQEQAGTLVGYSASAMSRMERGGHVDVTTLLALADCYGVEPWDLGLGSVVDDLDVVDERGPVRRREFLSTAGLTVPAWMLTRLDDALAALPEPSGAVSAPTVATRLAECRLLYDTGRHRPLLAALPNLLATVHRHADTAGDPTAWATVAACYELATHFLSKLGRRDLSRLTVDRAMTYARLSESAVSIALASRAMSIVLRHEQRFPLAQQVNLDAISAIEATGLVTPAQRTMFVQMLCSTAYAAAQSGDGDRAIELTKEADRTLWLLPEAPSHPATPVNATALTPAQVQLYKVGMHWSRGDSAAALHAAQGLHPAMFPTAERRGRLCTDLARAWWQHGRPDQTVKALLTAHRYARAEVVDRPGIRRIATDLTDRHPQLAGARQLRAILRSAP